MYINKRMLKKNHIANKLSYTYINRTKLKIDNKNKLNLVADKSLNIKNSNECANYLLSDMLTDENAFGIFRNETFDEKFKRLEQQPLEYFKSYNNEENIYDIDNFLYHGIRFQRYLEKLESIFKDRAILAGNYCDNYYSYSDNCNNGEYISLTTINSGIVYDIFIKENISLVISSKCNAVKTIYLDYEEWDKIKNLYTNNRYSYANGEYQVRKIIPIELVRAIGVPSLYFKLTNRSELIDRYINDIIKLMDKYNIELPIVDTSNYNKILFCSKNYYDNYTLKRIRVKNNRKEITI